MKSSDFPKPDSFCLALSSSRLRGFTTRSTVRDDWLCLFFVLPLLPRLPTRQHGLLALTGSKILYELHVWPIVGFHFHHDCFVQRNSARFQGWRDTIAGNTDKIAVAG